MTQTGVPAAGPAPRRPVNQARITGILLALLVVLCVGGGTGAYFVVTTVTSRGAASPAEGVDGFLCATDDELPGALERVAGIDRLACRAGVDERFSVARMVEGYVDAERRLYGVWLDLPRIEWSAYELTAREVFEISRELASLWEPAWHDLTVRSLFDGEMAVLNPSPFSRAGLVDEDGWRVCRMDKTG